MKTATPRKNRAMALTSSEWICLSRWLCEWRKTLSQEQWMESYQSWSKGGRGWVRTELGGTDIQTCITVYQHKLKPGSKEWRPSVIFRACVEAAGLRHIA